jgi:diadenosine tetraphosphatase ApaH/serine/threonine PP2A family protein phosphatase
LLDLDRPVHFIHGNGELAMLALLAAPNEDAVTYWGTTSGKPLPEVYRPVYRWTAQQLKPDYPPVLARWPKTFQLEIDGLGTVLFCHSTPRSETEVFTRLTPAERLVSLFDGLPISVMVCGHTHMQFDRQVGQVRVVNAGSVGEPYGAPGAYWLLLGPDIQLRRTPYDLAQAAELIQATSYPEAETFAQDLLHPPSEEEMLKVFTPWELK